MAMHPSSQVKSGGADSRIRRSDNSSSNGSIRGKHSQGFKETESITFRLDSTTLNRLRNEARQRDISVNTFVSQILKQHMEWHLNAARAGFLYVRKGLVVKLLDKYTDDEIKMLAADMAANSNKRFLLMLNNEYSVQSALEFIEMWIKMAGYPYRHEISSHNKGRHSFVIQHEMGAKWSLYLSELYRNMFEGFGLGKVIFDITDTTLSFTVDTEVLL
jgi:hypothetical protein